VTFRRSTRRKDAKDSARWGKGKREGVWFTAHHGATGGVGNKLNKVQYLEADLTISLNESCCSAKRGGRTERDEKDLQLTRDRNLLLRRTWEVAETYEN